MDKNLKQMTGEELVEEVMKLRENIRAHRVSTQHELCCGIGDHWTNNCLVLRERMNPTRMRQGSEEP